MCRYGGVALFNDSYTPMQNVYPQNFTTGTVNNFLLMTKFMKNTIAMDMICKTINELL